MTSKDFFGWVAPGLESETSKHLGNAHDQKLHGRWAGNKNSETSRLLSMTRGLSYSPQEWDDTNPRLSSKEIHALISDARANGGFTYKPTQGYPKNGFAVAVYPQHTRFVDIDKGDKKTVEKAFKDYYRDVVSPTLKKDPAAHWGAWYDTDSKILVFDMSRVVKNREDGIKLGKQFKQKAIWDIEKMDEVSIELGKGEKYADDEIREGKKAMKDPKGKMTRLEFDNKCDPEEAWRMIFDEIKDDLDLKETSLDEDQTQTQGEDKKPVL